MSARLHHGGPRLNLPGAPDIDLPGAQALAGELAATSAHVPMACHLDLGDPASVEAMIAMAVDRLGGLDALVNNAADSGAYVNGQAISVDGGANSHARFYMNLPLKA